VTNGADILSNSWGGGLPSSAIDEAIQFANTAGRDGKGAIPIFAAGNSDRDTVSYPASGEHLIWCSTPWQATVGRHELRGWVDPDGSISEFEENNNMIEAVIVVRTDEVEIFSDGFETGDVSTWSDSAS